MQAAPGLCFSAAQLDREVDRGVGGLGGWWWWGVGHLEKPLPLLFSENRTECQTMTVRHSGVIYAQNSTIFVTRGVRVHNLWFGTIC